MVHFAATQGPVNAALALLHPPTLPALPLLHPPLTQPWPCYNHLADPALVTQPWPCYNQPLTVNKGADVLAQEDAGNLLELLLGHLRQALYPALAQVDLKA